MKELRLRPWEQVWKRELDRAPTQRGNRKSKFQNIPFSLPFLCQLNVQFLPRQYFLHSFHTFFPLLLIRTLALRTIRACTNTNTNNMGHPPQPIAPACALEISSHRVPSNLTPEPAPPTLRAPTPTTGTRCWVSIGGGIGCFWMLEYRMACMCICFGLEAGWNWWSLVLITL